MNGQIVHIIVEVGKFDKKLEEDKVLKKQVEKETDLQYYQRPTPLRKFTNQASTVITTGHTVAEAVSHLAKQ